MSPPDAIRFEAVSKRFRLGESHDSLRDLLAAGVGRLLGQRRERDARHFWALREVDFAVPAGDTLGVIGPNGAGKSTALKLLAGILRPDEGTVRVAGRLASLIEVGAGFHGDLTGRENVFLNGAILGMSRAEVRRKLDAIVAFAGLEKFLDTPVKRYSSGMYARLGFSIAAHVDPEILLVDEVLSVGDAVFRLKCLERMRQLVRGGTTLVFVTHDLDQMQAVCGRAIVLDKGRVCFAGPSPEAVAHYLRAMSQSYAHRPADLHAESVRGSLAVGALRWLDADGAEIPSVFNDEGLSAELTLLADGPIEELVVELNMRGPANESLLSFNSARSGTTFRAQRGETRIRLDLPALPLAGGQYYWGVRVWDAGRSEVLLDTPFQYTLLVHSRGTATGALCLDHSWRQVLPAKSEQTFLAECAV